MEFTKKLTAFHSSLGQEKEKNSSLLQIVVVPIDHIKDNIDEEARVNRILDASLPSSWKCIPLRDSRLEFFKRKNARRQIEFLTRSVGGGQQSVFSQKKMMQQKFGMHQFLIVDSVTGEIICKNGVKGIENDPEGFPWADGVSPTFINRISFLKDKMIPPPMDEEKKKVITIIDHGGHHLNLSNAQTLLTDETMLCVYNSANDGTSFIRAKNFLSMQQQQQQQASAGVKILLADLVKEKYLLAHLSQMLIPPLKSVSGENVLNPLGAGFFIFDIAKNACIYLTNSDDDKTCSPEKFLNTYLSDPESKNKLPRIQTLGAKRQTPLTITNLTTS